MRPAENSCGWPVSSTLLMAGLVKWMKPDQAAGPKAAIEASASSTAAMAA